MSYLTFNLVNMDNYITITLKCKYTGCRKTHRSHINLKFDCQIIYKIIVSD